MMRTLTSWTIPILVLCLLPSAFAEELVEGIAAIVTVKKRNPIREMVFISDLDRYTVFFEPELAKADRKQQLDALIHQRLFRPEARRFILDGPTPEAVEAELEVIRGRFETEADFKRALQQTGLLLNELKTEVREHLWVKALLDERIKEFIFISPRAIETYYREHADRYAGKTLEAVEKSIEARLRMEKEALKQTEYLQRLKSNAEIIILLK